VTRTIVAAEIDIRNTVAVIAAALLPSAVLGLKAAGTTLLPVASLFALLRDFLLTRALLLDRLIELPLINLLLLLAALPRVPVLLLLLRLLSVLVLLLLAALPRVPVFLLLLRLLSVLVLLLLLAALLSVPVLLLLLCLLPVLVLLLLLAPLLRGLSLFFRPVLLVSFLFLLGVPESGGS